MSMESYETYLQYLAKTPNEMYRDKMQADVDVRWYNTTRHQTIYEENFDLNFDDKYQVISDTISNTYTNIDKIMGDYNSFQYRDCKHEIKRGQYIKWNDEYHLVYQGTNELSTVSKCKVIKCTNKIKWYDIDTHDIKEYPVVIGQELSSTNPQVDGDGTTPNGRLVVMLQCNEFTKKIELNQRFVLSHKQVFVVDEIDAYNLSDYENDRVDVIKLYISWVATNINDDLENNISNNISTYSLNISQDTINQITGFTGKLTTTVMLNAETVNIPVIYSTSDDKVVEVDNEGNYTLIGNVGDTAQISCCIDGNESILDTVTVNIVEDLLVDDKIIIEPEFSELYQYEKITFTANLYKDSELSTEIVTCTASNISSSYYNLIESIDRNEFTLECLKSSITPLILTFESGIITKQIEVSLLGFI